MPHGVPAVSSNAFNALRLAAALLVLWSHCYPLTGNRLDEPLRRLIGVSGGEIAVDAFFVVSGFLIAGSLERSRSWLDFALARATRIYPALWALLVATLVVYLTWTDLSPREMLGAAWQYALRNGLMLSADVAHELPGLFEDNLYPKAINGSLWTLPWEIRMYALLALIGTVLRRQARMAYTFVAVAALVTRLLAAGQPQWFQISPLLELVVRFVGCYFIGAAVCAWRISPSTLSRQAMLGLVLLIASLVSQRPVAILLAYMVSIPWIVLGLGTTSLRRSGFSGYIQRNDLSYGSYLYAFPVQQGVVALGLAREPPTLFWLSVPLVLVLAWLSWTFVERPALRWRRQKVKPLVRVVPE